MKGFFICLFVLIINSKDGRREGRRKEGKEGKPEIKNKCYLAF